MAVSTLNCPGCGAPAASDAVACDYCAVALATVACPACFATMFVGSRFCPRCGTEARREILDEESPTCVACREEMRAVRVGAISFRECAGCGSVWMDAETFERLCGDREQHAAIRGYVFTQTRPGGAVGREAVRYRRCPRCAALMNRTNFARRSGVILDICAGHGAWLDHGELGRLVAFIDGGGMAAARERDRERERLEEELRRTRAIEPTPMQTEAARRARTTFERRAFENLAAAARVERSAERLRDTVLDVGLGILRVLFWFVRLIVR